MNAAPAAAQTQEGTKPSVPHEQVISANPFVSRARLVERRVREEDHPSSTWGVNGSFLGVDDVDVVSLNGLWRYYPQGAALTGVYLGARAGVYRGSDAGEAHSAFGAGFEIGYTRLLGARRNIGLSLGAGLTRLFGGDEEDWPGAVPTVRLLNVGVAF